MKKSLLAVAAIGAFASAAQAQSSVTVYGILDVGFQGVTSRGPVSATNTSNVSTNKTGFTGEGSETTSRLGFKGTEDLGGGMSAFFTAEFALNPTNATLSGDTNGGLANRQSFVGLKKNGVGQAAIGTQYTPIHLAVGRTDPGMQNNMLGNVIYVTNPSQGNGQTTTAYTVRYNQALTLQTERMAGFQLSAIYNNSNSGANNTVASSNTSPATTAAAGSNINNNTAWGLGANYVWQKLNLDAAYQASNQKTTIAGGAQGVAPAFGGASNVVGRLASNPLGTNISMAQMYAGATYDFGILKAYAQFVQNKATANGGNADNYAQRSAQQIGVRSFVTPKVEAWASLGNGSFKSGTGSALPAGTTNATQNFTGYQLGSNYWLSKRTNLYAIFGATQVSGSSVNVSEGGSSYGVGVRHTF